MVFFGEELCIKATEVEEICCAVRSVSDLRESLKIDKSSDNASVGFFWGKGYQKQFFGFISKGCFFAFIWVHQRFFSKCHEK